MKFFLYLLAGVLATAFYPTSNQTILTGKITDDQGEVLIGATVKVTKGTDFVRGTITDYNGEYRVELDPGTYDIEVSYTGYEVKKITGTLVIANTINRLDCSLYPGAVLEEVVVKAYKVPLIQQDNTMSGQTITTQQISNMPTRSVNAIAAKTAGSTSVDGGAVHVKGSRSKATNYYVDGIRVSGTPPPVQDAEKSGKKDRKMHRDTTQPPSDFSAEAYNTIYENPFLEAQANAVSTFSIDVDAASYSNARRFLQHGQLPPADAVRIEEFVNYFDYAYPAPTGKDPFSVNTELAECPWNTNHRLLLIGLQGRQIETGQLPASNFVFLIDVSGSMNAPNKLPLVQESLKMLTDQMRPHDRVAIVVYAGAAGLVLPSTPGSDKPAIKAAIERLSAGGSTAGAAGIQLAYDVARKNLVRGGNNRVVLCTDGDFNVGLSNESELVKLIETERESGVFLTVLGYGTGNYQDGKMQQLADKGNGNHAYIDQVSEAKKVLISEFGGTMFAIAKDVKIQIEFNPNRVAGYRLIGYENRLLAREDFDDDTKDAGELGAGHRVTALYEIVPAGRPLPAGVKNGEMRYQETKPTAAAKSDELLTLKLRYKQPKVGASSSLIQTTVADKLTATPSNNFQMAASVAEFGLLLRNSAYKGTATYERCLARAQKAAKTDPSGYRKELCELIEKARLLAATETARK
ncbi:MAG: von Willebrand factor type A domain-containing protein [Lewinellaceae bacterium]|nr:von Willebrand factor type A domain-containing protein [Saprospiraceae bacterium]MCB9333416.1 von Willebrand factor type A domain-containing protein [Lewinellaceae bacterium]